MSSTLDDIRESRRTTGLTQEELAQAAGCSVSFIRLLERGYEPRFSAVLLRIRRILISEGAAAVARDDAKDRGDDDPVTRLRQSPEHQKDWFSIACGILAPGTTHTHTDVHATTWDAFDKLEAHDWTYRSWWVDPKTLRKVPPRTPGARLHEQRDRTLLDGTTATCHPPTGDERPATMVCIQCMGRGWRLVTDEDGDPRQDECRECDGCGRLGRPAADPVWAVDPDDFAPPATEGSLDGSGF